MEAMAHDFTGFINIGNIANMVLGSLYNYGIGYLSTVGLRV